MATEQPGTGPGIDRSKSIEDLHHLRLMALLDELVRDKGARKAAADLGVDHRTLAASLESGRLSRRMRVALDRALLAGGGSPAREQRERNDLLAGQLEQVEGRVENLGQDVNQGLADVQGDVNSLRNEHGQALQRVESRLARVEEGGGAARSPASANPVGRATGRRNLRRDFPDLVTIDPAEDDEEVFGLAWPLVEEWRELRDTHPDRAKGLAWLRTEERFLAVELALLEEHGLTLPPETYPLRGLDRGAQVNWRRKALEDTRKALKRRELLILLRRWLPPGLWRG